MGGPVVIGHIDATRAQVMQLLIPESTSIDSLLIGDRALAQSPAGLPTITDRRSNIGHDIFWERSKIGGIIEEDTKFGLRELHRQSMSKGKRQ
jgi:hypothetical protein